MDKQAANPAEPNPAPAVAHEEGGEISRRSVVGALMAGGVVGSALSHDSQAEPGDTARIFLGTDLAGATTAAEAAVPPGKVFKAVGQAENLSQVRRRTVAGSALLYTEVTTGALAADSGFTLIKYKRPGKGTFARTAAQMADAGIIDADLSIMNWIDPEFDSAIRGHTLATDISGMVQRGLDQGARSFPPGRYYFTAGLTLPDFARLAGQTYEPGAPPDRALVELRFCLASGAAIRCGYNPTFEYLYFTNCSGVYDDTRDRLSGTAATCLALLDSATIIRSSFAYWGAAVALGDSTYYLKTDMVEFNRCLAGYRSGKGAPYNLHFDKPISRKTRLFFDGGTEDPARNIKIFGGSIEGFSTVARNFLDLTAFGTYFETTPPHDTSVAIEARLKGASVALYGNLIYMNHLASFVDMTGAELAMLTGSGNNFDGVGRTDGACYVLPASGTVSLSGDRFGAGHPQGLRYVDDPASARRLGGVSFPALPANHAQAAYTGRSFIGAGGLIGDALASEPPGRIVGATVLADGVAWDPLGLNAGHPYWVLWRGDRWSALSGG